MNVCEGQWLAVKKLEASVDIEKELGDLGAVKYKTHRLTVDQAENNKRN